MKHFICSKKNSIVYRNATYLISEIHSIGSGKAQFFQAWLVPINSFYFARRLERLLRIIHKKCPEQCKCNTNIACLYSLIIPIEHGARTLEYQMSIGAEPKEILAEREQEAAFKQGHGLLNELLVNFLSASQAPPVSPPPAKGLSGKKG